MFRKAIYVGVCLLLASVAIAHAKKGKEPEGKMVDSGSFGVFMNGRRVATETFSIQQGSSGSIATSHFKTETGVDPASQSSELQLTSSGDIRKYEWKELIPGKGSAVVMPSNDFLMERSSKTPEDKPQEQPFLLPASTSILDDYFFIQREILAWKYLATGCRHEQGQVQCPLQQKVQFGTLNPHQGSSMLVSIEFMGKDKVQFHGAERELNHFILKSEGGDWSLWLDDQFKLMRILIASDNTEVVRD